MQSSLQPAAGGRHHRPSTRSSSTTSISSSFRSSITRHHRQQQHHHLQSQQQHAQLAPVATTSSRHRAQQQRRVRLIAAASADSGDYGAAYDNLFKSKVFQSEMVVREFDSIMTQLRQLSMMASRFCDFDIAGKEMFLEKMDESIQRYRVFFKRLELSAATDPAAAEYLRYTSAQMLEGGFTHAQMFEGVQQSLVQYKSWVEQERRASSDPVKHQEFLQAFRQAWSQSALGAVDMGQLAQMASPEVVARAQKDPEFYKAIKEISENPNAMSKWVEHPNIGPLVSTMFKAMMAGREARGGGGGQR